MRASTSDRQLEAEAPSPISSDPGQRLSGTMRHRQRWKMLALIFLVYLLAKADAATMSIAAPEMMDRFGIGPFELGLIFSGFAWGNGLMALPAGIFVDRLGARTAIVWGILIWSAATAMAGWAGLVAGVVVFLFVVRGIIGVAEATVTPGSATVLASWFPDRERGVATSLWSSAGYVGLAVAAPFMGLIITTLGWQWVFWIMAAIGLIVLAIWRAWYHHPSDHPHLHPDELTYIASSGGLADRAALRARRHEAQTGKAGTMATLKSIYLLLKRRDMLAIFIGQYCGNAIAFFLFTWIPTYLVKDRGVDILHAGLMIAMPGVAAMTGVIASGSLIDLIFRRTGSMALSRKIPLTVGYCLCATMALFPYAHSTTAIVALLTLAFLGKGFANVGWTLIADISPPGLVGTAGGMMNTIGSIGAVVTGVTVGALVQAQGSFNTALLFMGAHGLLAVAFFWLFLPNMQRVDLAECNVE